MIFAPVVYEHAAAFIKKTPWEVSRDAALLAKAHTEAHKIYGHSPITVGVDIYNLEAESYGAVIPEVEGDEVPTIRDFPFSEPEELLSLDPLDLHSSGRWPMALEAACLVKESLPDVNISLPLGGPFSIAVNLCGFENFILYSAIEEERSSSILNHLADHQIHLASQIHEAGFGVSFFESAATPPMLSPSMFRNLEFPVLQRIIKSLNDMTGNKAAFILGGDTALIASDLADLDAGFLICPSETDQSLFLENLGELKIPVRINMDAAILASRHKINIQKEVERIKTLMVRFPGTIAGSGVLPYDADPEFIKKVGGEF